MLGIGDSTASYIVKVSDFSCHLTLSPVIVTDIIMSGSFYTICSMHGSTSPVNSCYAHCLYIMVHKGQMGGGGGVDQMAGATLATCALEWSGVSSHNEISFT